MKIRVSDHRSAVAEWQPHATQGDQLIEWWNLTGVVRDPAGLRYFLSWTVTHRGSGQPYAGRLTLISSQASVRQAGVAMVFGDDEHKCDWSFDGERMNLAVNSPTLTLELTMRGGSPVLWADDFYTLPRLRITGSITYADERGKPIAVDVSGSGWADRQWDDTPVRIAARPAGRR